MTRSATVMGPGVDTRHLPLLEAIDGKQNVSQRALAERLGTGASQVNRLIAELLAQGHLEVVDEGVRPFAYRLTEAGLDYRRRLSHAHLRAVIEGYHTIENRIRDRLRVLKAEGVRQIVFLGTVETEVLEVVHRLSEEAGLEIVEAVDEDAEKHTKGWEWMREANLFAVLATKVRQAHELRTKLGLRDASHLRVVEL